MHVIGLAGPAGSGKDTVAKHLGDRHDYLVFSFSDTLYREVALAYGCSMSLLLNRATKETPTGWLALRECVEPGFVKVAMAKLALSDYHDSELDTVHLSPRWVLQTWGTDYRRQQNPRYWLDRASDWLIDRMRERMPEFYRLKVVNTSVRFPNEADWIRRLGGEVWHMRRAQCPLLHGAEASHVSETPVVVEPQDTVIHNNGSINSLWTAITLRLGDRNLREVRVEPEEAPK